MGAGLESSSHQLWCTGFGCPRHLESSQIRDRACVPCIGRCIPAQCTTREVQKGLFLKIYFDKLRLSETIIYLLLSESGNTWKILLSLKCIHEINDECFYLNKSAPWGRCMRFLKIQVMCLGQRKIEEMTLQGCFVYVCLSVCVYLCVCSLARVWICVCVCVWSIYVWREGERFILSNFVFRIFIVFLYRVQQYQETCNFLR